MSAILKVIKTREALAKRQQAMAYKLLLLFV
jgi:hypothetical protein